MTYDKYLETQSKEQLIIFLKNERLMKEKAQERLSFLTGCPVFGDFDPMDGSCVYCDELTPEQCYRCRLMSDAFKQWARHCEARNDVSYRNVNVCDIEEF